MASTSVCCSAVRLSRLTAGKRADGCFEGFGCERGDGFLGFNSIRNTSNFGQIYDVGAYVDFSILERLRLRGGYNAMWLTGVATVGLTAGASAPEELVADVIEALRRHGPVDVEEMDGVRETMEFRLPKGLRKPDDTLLATDR